jgi:hypothetical protein
MIQTGCSASLPYYQPMALKEKKEPGAGDSLL